MSINTTKDFSDFADATFPSFTDNGGGSFSIRGSYAADAPRRFFQIETDSSEGFYTPDLSISVDVRNQFNGFGAFSVGSNQNVVYTGSALEFNSSGQISRITGTAQITQTVVSASAPTAPIPHLTRVFEEPYTRTRDSAPIDSSGPGLLPE